MNNESNQSKIGELIQSLSTPLEPTPTGEAAKLPKLEGIRAVVFDIYGTLLISASGDISLASEGSRGKAALDALAAVKIYHDDALDGDRVVEKLHAVITSRHQESSSKHPEVEIRNCWTDALREFDIEADAHRIEQLAVEYECRVNPIWPMPTLKELLQQINQQGLTLGIVSNAQFFTPLAFKPLTGKSLSEWGFSDALSIWSYEHLEAKPGIALYELSAKRLSKVGAKIDDQTGILPQEVLYVGNDMRNDIWPASLIGFKTALFAGDARSLRWRKEDPSVKGVTPDAVVTQLSQIMSLLD